MWRACHNSLPMKDNLLQRKVVSDRNCPICGLEAKTTYHVQWDCQSTRDVWGASELCFQNSMLQGPNFIQVVEGILNNYGKEALNTLAATARQIWLCRNEVVHGGNFTHPNIVVKIQR